MMIALKAATPQLPRTTAVADHVVAVDETDSTNALAVQMIGDGSLTLPDHQDGELAVAERQVEGFRERLVKFIADPKGQAESLREEVKAVCWARGRQVEAHFTDGTTLTGEAIGLNEDASLILRTQDGTDHTVRTADVGVL